MSHLYFSGDRRKAFIYPWLRAWHDLLQRYELNLGGDELPYIWGERANVGILAAAALNEGALFFLEANTGR